MGFPDVVKVMINSCHYVTTLLILAMPCHTTYLLVGLPPNTPHSTAPKPNQGALIVNANRRIQD